MRTKQTKTSRLFCRLMLRDAKARARAFGMGDHVKGLTVWRSDLGRNPWFEVWQGSEVVWKGNAYNADEAKYKYITSCVIDQYEDEVEG